MNRNLTKAERAVLEVLERGTGAAAMPFVLLREEIGKRGTSIPQRSLHRTLSRLIAEKIVTKVPTEDGGTLYVRTATLDLNPTYAAAIADAPARRVPHRTTTSPKTVKRREAMKVRRWQDEIVRRGGHDHRSLDRPCHLCGDWPPPMTGNLPRISKDVMTHFVS